MPKGHRKRGEFDFIIWFADGARLQWKSTRTQTDKDIADAIRRYLLPVAERLESAPATNAIDPSAQPSGTPTPREPTS